MIAVIIIVAIIIGIAVLLSNANDENTNALLDNRESNTQEATTNTQQNTATSNNQTTSDKKILIAYFSETGNTDKFANIIHEQIGGDMLKIEPVTPYPQGQELFDYTEKERDNDERPEIKGSINVADYDTIFVGYPIWWYTLPMIMYTFFDNYDFSGKTIIPFNTHEGSGNGGTYSTIKQFEPNATVLEGLPIRGGDMSQDQTDTISNWLKNIGVSPT